MFDAPPTGQKKLLRSLAGGGDGRAPVWLMRQAGRYLPEYTRDPPRRRGGFPCRYAYNSELAAEVTLQPIRKIRLRRGDSLRRHPADPPDALGADLWFVTGGGRACRRSPDPRG